MSTPSSTMVRPDTSSPPEHPEGCRTRCLRHEGNACLKGLGETVLKQAQDGPRGKSEEPQAACNTQEKIIKKYSGNNVAGRRLKTKAFSYFFEDFSLHLGRLPKFVAHVSRTPVTAPEDLLKQCPPRVLP